MQPTLVPLTLVLLTGLTLLFSEMRWVQRPTLRDRLLPHVPRHRGPARTGMLSVTSFREVAAPLAQAVGGRLSRIFGVSEDLSLRLRRIHSPLDVARFRTRQLAVAAAALLAGTVISIAIGLPPSLAFLAVVGSPVLGFLVQEQRLERASSAWQRRVFLELPVVAEQLGMLTSAGWSLSAALARVADRGTGTCAADLDRVTHRIHHGLTEIDALREWGEVAQVDALDRLISLLALNRETPDLGRLIAEEARSIRRDGQRELIESIEKRTQQVWVPVTVAALIPGVLLMGVPFVEALRLFSSS